MLPNYMERCIYIEFAKLIQISFHYKKMSIEITELSIVSSVDPIENKIVQMKKKKIKTNFNPWRGPTFTICVFSQTVIVMSESESYKNPLLRNVVTVFGRWFYCRYY